MVNLSNDLKQLKTKKYENKSHILNPDFKYTNSAQTDIKKTFEKVKSSIWGDEYLIINE